MKNGHFQEPGRLLPLIALLWLCLAATVTHAGESRDPAISIIIDDIGYRNVDDVEALELPGPVTYAIMPHSPLALRMSELAAAGGKEILLHLPMEAVEQDKNRYLGPGALTLDMNETQFISMLNDNLKAVPNVIGVNNHMGSLLSVHGERMRWLMRYLHLQRKFYVDSLTVSGTVASDAARDHGVPYLKRDVFLDNLQDPDYIEAQFDELLAIARRRGTALGIGHPHPETIAVLKRRLAGVQQHGIRLISLMEMLGRRRRDEAAVSLY